MHAAIEYSAALNLTALNLNFQADARQFDARLGPRVDNHWHATDRSQRRRVGMLATI